MVDPARSEFDLRNASFDEFVDYYFDRPDDSWVVECFWKEKFYPAQCLENFTRLFREPLFLLERFTRPQLEEGFFTIPNGHFEASVKSLLWNEEAALDQREECVRAMYFLYRDLFSIDHLVHSAHMWWDQLAFEYGYDLEEEQHPYQKGEAGYRLQQVMFETLCEILKLPSKDCQFDALHGLNHVRHAQTEPVLRAYMDAHPELDESWKAYIEACIEGKAM